MSSIDLTKPNRDTTLLAPFVQNRLLMALNECHDAGYPVAVFEAYRSPARQDYLYEQGRGRAGKKVTFSKAYQSAHQFGLAIDVAFLPAPKKWTWEGWPWDAVTNIFEDHGFETLDFEKSHFQIMAGMKYQEAYKIYNSQGMLALWDVVQRRFNGS